MFFLLEGARPEKPESVTKMLILTCSFGLLPVPGLLTHMGYSRIFVLCLARPNSHFPSNLDLHNALSLEVKKPMSNFNK